MIRWLKQLWCAMRGHGGISIHNAGICDDPWYECKRCRKQWDYESFLS